MKVAIMQPYFFPYLGYFQLIHATDVFVFYNDVQFIKNGYINRNRILSPQKSFAWITIPIRKASTYDAINTRTISPQYNRQALLEQLHLHYATAPYFKEVIPILSDIIKAEENDLSRYIENSIRILAAHLEIETQFLSSQDIALTHLKAQDRVIAISKQCKASHYINSAGGLNLYNKKAFLNEEIQLSFIKMNDIRYRQFNNDFVPNLSIIDVLMFNSLEYIKHQLLKDYVLK